MLETLTTAKELKSLVKKCGIPYLTLKHIHQIQINGVVCPIEGQPLFVHVCETYSTKEQLLEMSTKRKLYSETKLNYNFVYSETLELYIRSLNVHNCIKQILILCTKNNIPVHIVIDTEGNSVPKRETSKPELMNEIVHKQQELEQLIARLQKMQ